MADQLNKRSMTRLSVAAAALLSAAMAWVFFASSISRASADAVRAESSFYKEQALLLNKTTLQAEWEAKKNAIDLGADAEAALSAWVNSLLSFAQSQSLNLEKLEPAGVKSEPEGKTLAVFISFKGDIRRLIRFIYGLADSDSMSQIRFFSIRQEEGSKDFSFELMLGKAIR